MGLRDGMRRRFARVNGFTAVLMKRRNGQSWTPEDRRYLKDEMVTLARYTPALVVFMLPGGMVMLAATAWYLDRRRKQRIAPVLSGTASAG